jgi:uncharacterized SAM-binding protein YcdF (DUF218 family)
MDNGWGRQQTVHLNGFVLNQRSVTRKFPSRELVRTLRFAVLALVVWCLLAWLAAAALITRADISQADVIVVLSNATTYVERIQLAAELWKEGRARRVVLTNDNILSGWSETQNRNPLFYELATKELERSGVVADQITVLPEAVNSTYDEALLFRTYVAEHNLRSVLIVTSAYHSRRALRIFRDVLRDSGVSVGLEAVPPGRQTPGPATWWLRPRGWMMVAPEYPKLLYWVCYAVYGIAPTGESAPITSENIQRITGADRSGLKLSLVAPITTYVDESVLIDARDSLGVSKRPQLDGTPSLVIDFGDGFNCNLMACGHAYRNAGSYKITVTAKDGDGISALPVVASINVVEIPSGSGLNVNDGLDQNVIDMSAPRGNPLYYISPQSYRNATGNASKLQMAIKRAAANNARAVQEIILPAGATFGGPIVLSTPKGGKYITLRSAHTDKFSPRNRRVVPEIDGPHMPTIQAPTSINGYAIGTPLPVPASPSHHYRLVDLHISKDNPNNSKQFGRLVALGNEDSGQNTIGKIPHHFIITHCWIDGGNAPSITVTGIRSNANYVTIADSYIAELRQITGVDSTAISVGNSEGPNSIVNNFLSATSECLQYGGGDHGWVQYSGTISAPTRVSATLSSVAGLSVDQNIALMHNAIYDPVMTTTVRSISGNNITFEQTPFPPDNGTAAKWGETPSFGEIRRNYFFKPLTWWPSHPSFAGTNYLTKNLFETKNMRYVVVDGNLFENHWLEDQTNSIVLGVRNAEGATPFAVVRDVQWSNNKHLKAFSGISFYISDDQRDATNGRHYSQISSDLSFRNNLFENFGERWNPGADKNANMLLGIDSGDSKPNHARRINWIHNTADIHANHSTQFYFQFVNFGFWSYFDDSTFVNNVINNTSDVGGFISNTQPVGTATIQERMPGVNWNKNLMPGADRTKYPVTGLYPSTWKGQFISYSTGDFTLADNSPGKRAALDGKDLGVDTLALEEATKGARSGNWLSVEPNLLIRPRRTREASPAQVKP